jgi:hypothetical protein
MKISSIDYTHIAGGIRAALSQANISHHAVETTAQMWQVFHHAWARGHIDGTTLYREYNDAHIETALKNIFRKAN